MRLLLVDDDDVFRERLAVAMRRRGYEVRTAASGACAMNEAVHFSPEAAVVDMRMPAGGGLPLIERLKQEFPVIRIVVLTGYGSIANAVEAVRLGADDYLTKPTDGDQIDQALRGQAKRSPTTEAVEDVATLSRVEWEHLQRVLSDCGHNISQAARILGLDRRSLQRKLKKNPPSR
jgi:two-component system response regulator RegA